MMWIMPTCKRELAAQGESLFEQLYRLALGKGAGLRDGRSRKAGNAGVEKED